jgi:Ca2+-binding RTX toxin-like protein
VELGCAFKAARQLHVAHASGPRHTKGAARVIDLISPPVPPSGEPNVTAPIATAGGVSVAAGELLYAAGLPRMFASPDRDPNPLIATLTNAGTIWNDNDGGSAVLSVTDWGRIANSGVIVAHSGSGDAVALRVASAFEGLTNSGSIYALSDTQAAFAFADWSPGAAIDNSGLIAARGAIAQTLSLNEGGELSNSATGSILAEGAGAVAVYLGRGHLLAEGQPPSATDVTNRGRIEARSTDPGQSSVAIYAAHLASESVVIDNHGTIRGDFAIFSDSFAFATPQQSRDQVSNAAGGVIEGQIDLGLGDDSLFNAGQITGFLDMGDGNDLVDTRAGVHVGNAELGRGDDIYLGGSGFDAATGNRGNDQLSGGGGDDLLIGGWGDDVLRGDAGNDALYGERGNDTIVTSGGDFVDAGRGDDRVILGDYAFAKLVGGSGHDVLVLPADARVLSLSEVAASGRVESFEEIALASGGHLVVQASDVAALTGGSMLTISAQESGVVDLAGSWTVGASQTIGGVLYDSYWSGAAQLLVAHPLTVNLGSDPANPMGLDPIAAGPAAPPPGIVPGAELTVERVHNDFDGDGRSDILWRSDGGLVAEWLAAPEGFSAGWETTVALDWKVAGTGDFDGDGRFDLLWRSDGGALSTWLASADGGFVPGWGTGLATEWTVAGAADFNGDGLDDILWRSDSGALSNWLAAPTGGFVPGWGTSVALDWTVVGTGDFNGDGFGDILWRSGSGALADWLGSITGGFSPGWGTTVATEWTVAGTGDFNGDGLSDILWRSDGGAVAEWLGAANGGFTSAWGTAAPAGSSIASIGDFNGDGFDDILWREDSSGRLSEWLGTTGGGFIDHGADFSAVSPAGWHVQEPFL